MDLIFENYVFYSATITMNYTKRWLSEIFKNVSVLRGSELYK